MGKSMVSCFFLTRSVQYGNTYIHWTTKKTALVTRI